MKFIIVNNIEIIFFIFIFKIHLLAGRSLRSTSSRVEPVRDLYCVLECDRAHKARTVIRTGDVNFDWDETFDLDLVVNRELDFLIYSWDPQLRHRLCFKGSLHLVPLLRESSLHQVAKLCNTILLYFTDLYYQILILLKKLDYILIMIHYY